MRRGLMRGRAGTHSVIVSWVVLALVLGGCSSSSSHRSSAETSTASSPILSAVKPPTWAAVGSTHVVRYDPTADVITVDLDQQTQNFCGVTAAPGTCGA